MKIYKFLILFTSSLFTFSALAENVKKDLSVPPVVIPGVYGNPDKVGRHHLTPWFFLMGRILISGRAPRAGK
jgi:hypothetical protein